MTLSERASSIASGAARQRLAGDPAAQAGAANANFLFEMIVADLHWTALQMGSLCMMVAACHATDRFSLRSCRHIAYDDTRVMRLALRFGEDVGLPSEVRGMLDRLYADIPNLQRQIAPFVAATTLSAAQRSQLQSIVPPLRKLALAVADTLGKLEPVTRARLHANYLEDGVTIRQFLTRAARGDLSEVDRFGVLTAPRIKQRRQSPRLQVNTPCMLSFSGGEVAAAIVDVSREGLGVICKTKIAENQPLVVRVGSRLLEAVVARSQGTLIGLTLKKPLSISDPLFSAG